MFKCDSKLNSVINKKIVLIITKCNTVFVIRSITNFLIF